VIEDREPFVLHCGWDDWQDIQDLPAEPLPFGLWGVTIASERQAGRSVLNFIRRYGDRWEQGDHAVAIVDAPRTVTLVHAEKSP